MEVGRSGIMLLKLSAVTHTPVCNDVGSGPTWPAG